MLDFDWSHFTEKNFEQLKNDVREKTSYEEPTTYGYVVVGDLAVDIMSRGDSDTMREDGTMDVAPRFDLFQPIREGQSEEDDISVIEGYPYRFNDEDLDLAYNLPSEVVLDSTYYDFVEQVERTIENAAAAEDEAVAQLGIEDIVQDINTNTLFWQRLALQQERPDCKIALAEDPAYKMAIIIPPGYYDATEAGYDSRPVIKDDKDLVYIVQDHEKKADRFMEGSRYKACVDVTDFFIESLPGSFHDIIAQGDDFDEVMGKVKEIYPALEEANTRLDKILNRSDSSELFESSFRMNYITGLNADQQDASCIAAVKETMAKTGQSLNQMLSIVDEKAPMAVFERKGKYASKIMKQVKKDLDAEKNVGR